jgi:hypothetical protein
MSTIDPKTVVEKYDEINQLETRMERLGLLNKQSDEMQVALWHENVDRKTKGVELSAEQKEIIDTIRKKFFTVEFRKSARGKNEGDAGEEYHDIMGRANQLLGNQMLSELFGIIGDSKTMKWS